MGFNVFDPLGLDPNGEYSLARTWQRDNKGRDFASDWKRGAGSSENADNLKAWDMRKPKAPGWNSLIGGGGQLRDAYQVKDQLDTRALDSLRTEGLRAPGTQSTWADLMTQDLNSQQNLAQDQTAAQTAGLQAGQLAQMGSMGGYDRGSMERMGRTSFRDMLRQKQNNRSEFGQKRLDVSKQDESNRINSLNNLNNAETGRANYLTGLDSTNTQGALSEYNAQRDYNMNKYSEDLRAWGGERNAIATENAAKNAPNCFKSGTLICLNDGTEKRIEDVNVGDDLLLGGKVTAAMSFACDEPVYNFKGVFVTGGHAVIEGFKFKRVKDTRSAVLTDEKPEIVYNLSTVKHRICIGAYVFADYDEQDVEVTDERSIELLNEQCTLDEAC